MYDVDSRCLLAPKLVGGCWGARVGVTQVGDGKGEGVLPRDGFLGAAQSSDILARRLPSNSIGSRQLASFTNSIKYYSVKISWTLTRKAQHGILFIIQISVRVL